jgi:VanZ family protein
MLQHIKNWWLANSFFVAIAISFVIVVLSLIPTTALLSIDVKISDKFLHSIAYVGLMWVWLIAFRGKERIKTGIILLVLLTFFGIILELLQGEMTTYRTPDWRDVLANFTGLLVGFFTFKVMFRLVFKGK